MGLYNLVRSNEHDKIVQLGEEFQSLKTVAHINMGNYGEALKCAARGSFEMAYILYKLRKYKRALRILRGMDSEASRVLRSQCLYYLGYYNGAYQMLSGMKRDDDVVVNLQAMKSLAIAADRSQSTTSRLCVRKMDISTGFDNLERHGMSSAEGHVDFVFNQAFENLPDEERFVGFLESRIESDSRLRGTVVEGQLRNVRGEFDRIDRSVLSRTQRETLEFNRGETDTFSNPQHFQQNFARFERGSRASRRSESLWIEEAYRDGLKMDDIPSFSKKMRLFRAFVLYRNGHSPRSRVESGNTLCEAVLSILGDMRAGREVEMDVLKRVMNEIGNKP